MSATTDYMNPFNDGYNIFNQFDRILFVPKHPLLQSELNELQSGQQDQQRWIADYSMNNGTILAGMGFKNEGYSLDKGVPDHTNPNLFSTKNLTTTQTVNGNTINDLIVTTGDNYTDHGEIDVTSDATQDSQPLTMSVSYNIPKGAQYITVSFDIAETGTTDDGALENIGMALYNDTSITEATIDGRILKDGELTDDADYNLTDTRNDLVNLSDGNYHKVVVTMDVSKDGSNTNRFDLILNAGFPSVSEGCNVKFDHFKIEQGTEPTTWLLSNNDEANVEGSDKRNDVALVSSGFVYLDGYVRRFNGGFIRIKGQGFEKIGLHLSRQVVNGASDNKIDDDTQGTSTYGQAAADREKYNLTLSYGSETMSNPHDTVIYYLYNGRAIARANWDRTAKFNNILARRSYETNGSFLATPRGLQMYAHPNTQDASLINLQFTPGVAYVLGHRIQKNGSDILPIPVERHTMHQEQYPHLRVLPHTFAKSGADPTTPYFKDIPFEYPHIKPEYTYSKDDNEYTGGVKVTDREASPQTFQIDLSYGTTSNIAQIILNGQPEDFDESNNQITFNDDTYVYDPHYPNYHIYQDNVIDTSTGKSFNNPKDEDQTKNFYTADDDDSDNIQSNQILWELSEITLPNGITINFGSGTTMYIRGDVMMTYRPYGNAFLNSSEMDNVPAGQAAQTSQGHTDKPDFYLIEHNNKYYISFNQCDRKLDITGAAQDSNVTLSGLTPVAYTSDTPEAEGDYPIDISYYTYLAREDLITLDRNGHFFDVTGEPNLENKVTPPTNKSRNDNLTLNIGYIKVLPNSQVLQTRMYTTPKVPFTNINDMRLELAKLRYDMSVLAANQSTMSYVNPVTLVDIFSDFFDTTDKANISDMYFSVLYNPQHYITPAYHAEGYLPLATKGMNANQNTLTMPLDKNGGNRVENTHYLNQDHQSNSSLPLNNFGLQDRIGTIVCDPEFINDKLTTEQINNPTDVEVLDSAQATAYLSSKEANGSYFSTLYADGGKATLNSLDTPMAQKTRDGQELQNKNSVITGYSRAYLAPQYIHIQGSGFIPNSTHYSVYLPNENNLHLSVTNQLPTNNEATDAVTPENGNSEDYDQILPGADNARNYLPGQASDIPGDVDADGEGNISCWFKIPKGQVRAMPQTVVLANDGGEKGTDEIDGITYQPYQYNTTNDVVIDNHDIINKNSDIASAATASLSASTSQDFSYLSSDISQLSASASNATASLSNVESQDNSMLIDGIGSVNVSMGAITSAEQQDRNNLSNLAVGVTNYMSYVDTNLSALSASDSDTRSYAQSNATDLYNSATSLYLDHLQIEQDLGNLRTGIDSVANNEAMLADNVNNDVSVYNQDFSNVAQNQAMQSASIANQQQQIATNNANLQNYSSNANQAMQDNYAGAAATYRDLAHDEYTPDSPLPGHQDSGFWEWCQKFNISGALVEDVKNHLVKPHVPLFQRWNAMRDFQLSQTQGGLWLKNTCIVPPNSPDDSISAMKKAATALASVELLNPDSMYSTVTVHYDGDGASINDKAADAIANNIGASSLHSRM